MRTCFLSLKADHVRSTESPILGVWSAFLTLHIRLLLWRLLKARRFKAGSRRMVFRLRNRRKIQTGGKLTSPAPGSNKSKLKQNKHLTTFSRVVILTAVYFLGGLLGKEASFMSGSVV